MNLFFKKQPEAPRRRTKLDSINNDSDAFRRNRTLLNPRLNESVNDSLRNHVHHLTWHRRRVMGILALVLLVSTGLWILISNFTATTDVIIVDVSASKTIDGSKYEQAIQEYFDDNPLGRLHFLLDQVALTSFVSSKLPEVYSVKQRGTVGVGKTEFSIIMRVPVAGWKISEKQYYVDSHGVSFETNFFSEPSVQIIDSNTDAIQSGSAVASNRFLAFVGKVVSESMHYGKTVVEAIIPENTTRELDIKLKDIKTIVKLSIDRSVGEQIEDMNNALQYFQQNNLQPKYIDVRVSGKAFYM